jgi:hypothetical protein
VSLELNKLDRVVSETRRLAHDLDHPINNGCALIVGVAGIGAVDLGADEVEGEEFECAIEGMRGLDWGSWRGIRA